MKNKIRNISSLALLGVMLLTTEAAFAQTPASSSSTTTTTTTTSDGTISQFGPEAIVVQSSSTSNPVSYSSTKTTTYVDQNGNPVSVETIKSGLPVTVYYDRDGDKMVATKVVVRNAAVMDPTATTTTQSTTTSATSSGGTVTQYGPDGIVIRSSPLAEPVSYSSSKTTTYVDEDGNTVSSETIKTGAPVTVYYQSVDGKMVATKVIVKKTTTTTTTP
jgi:uncharacterized protein (DUF2141 family)